MYTSMSSSHNYKHLHIDTRLRADTASKSDFTVSVPHGLTGATRVCLKSFSIPNSFGNLFGNNRYLYWNEHYNNGISPFTWVKKTFYIDLSALAAISNYATNVELANAMNVEFSAGDRIFDLDTGGTSHQFASEAEMGISVVYDTETYEFTFTFTQTGKHKVFVPAILDLQGSIWENIGFSEAKCASAINAVNILFVLNTVIVNSYTNIPTNEYLQSFHISDAFSSNDLEERVISSDVPSVHENHIQRLYVCSDTLVSDALVMEGTTAIPTNILDEIVNVVPKFSYLHKEMAGLPMWNRLLNPRLNRFDIKLLDQNGATIPDEAMPDYHMTLMFEVVQEIEYTRDEIEDYNLQGFQMAHRSRTSN